MMEVDRDELISEWSKAFKKGTDYDLWGQPVEAVDSYQRYVSSLLAKQLSFNDQS